MDQDNIKTVVVPIEIPKSKRRLNDAIVSAALIVILTADVCLRLVQIIMAGGCQ